MANRRRPKSTLRRSPGTSYPPTGLVARILAREHWSGDGPPCWADAPTARQTRRDRLFRIKRLRRFAEAQPAAEKLADTLARCKRRRRYMSGACPECGRAFQRFLVSEVRKLAAGESGQPLASVSIAFQKHRTAEDQLNVLCTTKLKRSLSETMNNANGLAWMAGGIDLSLNDDTQKKLDIAWQPQLYGFADVTSSETLSRMLRGSYRPPKYVPRPIRIQECDGSARAISYALKTEFVRRVAYRAIVGPPENRRKCWHTRKVSLRPVEHVQSMIWMHKVGLAGRLFLRGVRMTRVGDSVGLVEIKRRE